MREFPDKADSIGDHHLLLIIRWQKTSYSIQSAKETIICPDTRPGQVVEQSRLAAVGVAHQSYLENIESLFSLCFPLRLDFRQLPFQMGDLDSDLPAV